MVRTIIVNDRMKTTLRWLSHPRMHQLSQNSLLFLFLPFHFKTPTKMLSDPGPNWAVSLFEKIEAMMERKPKISQICQIASKMFWDDQGDQDDYNGNQPNNKKIGINRITCRKWVIFDPVLVLNKGNENIAYDGYMRIWRLIEGHFTLDRYMYCFLAWLKFANWYLQ